MMELKHLRYFVAVAAEGSFHRAAERLCIAQPALSRRIRDLEEDLDVILFHRSARGVRLTPAGKVLHAEALQILDRLTQARLRTQQAAAGKFGVLNIGLTTVVAEMRAAVAAIGQARHRVPEVEFKLHLIPSDRQVSALNRGDIDIGLLYRRPPHPPGLAYRDLRTDRYVVMVPASHRLAGRTSVRLADLEGEDMMFPSPELRPETYREMLEACQRGGLEPRIVLQAEGLINMVAEGIAIALYNSALAENAKIPGVVYLDVEDLDIPLQLSALWEKERETPALLALVQLLETAFVGSAKGGQGKRSPARRKAG
ncbi:LysR family transcriptional regulator [Haliea sp. E17]|uniref:LysR family transcriptional regulator n=1 Tax=Haliea sp. E17 TaxID=3401576 RepID=UPI003AAE1D5E